MLLHGASFRRHLGPLGRSQATDPAAATLWWSHCQEKVVASFESRTGSPSVGPAAAWHECSHRSAVPAGLYVGTYLLEEQECHAGCDEDVRQVEGGPPTDVEHVHHRSPL